MLPSQSSRMAPAMSVTAGGIGDKIRGAMAVGKTRWGMLALVFFATTLNYIDRAALGVMQPILAKEMSWTAMDYANINFWFQVGYAIGFVLQGRLIDRVGVKRVFFCAVLLWSLATGAHGLATSAAGFMVCRFILGLTEAANYLDGDGLRQHQLLVPGGLRHRFRAAGPADRQGWGKTRLLLRRTAVEPGHWRPWPGHFGGRLHGLPVSYTHLTLPTNREV